MCGKIFVNRIVGFQVWFKGLLYLAEEKICGFASVPRYAA